MNGRPFFRWVAGLALAAAAIGFALGRWSAPSAETVPSRPSADESAAGPSQPPGEEATPRARTAERLESEAPPPRDVDEVLRLGVPPTEQNLKRMLGELFAGGDSEPRIRQLLEMLAAGAFDEDLELRNAATFALQAALQAYFDPAFVEEHGAGPGDRLVTALLKSLADLPEDSAQALVAAMAATVRAITAENVAALRPLLLADPPFPGAVDLLRAFSDLPGAEDAYLELVLSLLSHPDSQVRAQAFGFLARFDPGYYAEQLRAEFAALESTEEKAAILQALADHLGPRKSVDLALTLLETSSPDERWDLITSMRPTLASLPSDDLLELAARNRDPELLQDLVAQLGRTQSDALRVMLADPRFESVRGQALLTLSRVSGDHEVLQTAEAWLRDRPDPGLVSKSALALYNLAVEGVEPSPETKLRLRELVLDPSLPASARKDCLMTLLRLDPSQKEELRAYHLPPKVALLLEGD